MKNVRQRNKMIKILSPYNGEEINIELKGSEESLKELLSTILHIPTSSIKGIKDNYNNYYTLSSALKSKYINNDANNYFSIITNNESNNEDLSLSDINKFNIHNNYNYINPNLYNNQYFRPNQFINNSDVYYNNIKINNIQNYGLHHKQKFESYSNYFKQYSKEAYYSLIGFLYKIRLIEKNNYYKLKKFIEVNNIDVMEILKPYIEFDNNYNKLINNLFPILNLDLSIKGKSSIMQNPNNKRDKSIYFDLLSSLKDNFTKENIKRIHYLLLIENMSIIQLFESYYQTGNKNKLIDDLYSLLKRVSKVDLNKSNYIMGNILRERKSKSQNYKTLQKIKNNSDNNIHSIKHNNKKKKYNMELLQKITDKIIKYGKKFSKDIYYLIQYELNTIPIEDKAELFSSKFNINIETKNKSFKELSQENKKNIKSYYKKYIKKNIYNFLDQEEKDIYLNIIDTPNSQEFNDIMEFYSDLIKDDKMKNKMELLRNKIINYLKDLKQLIEEQNKSSQKESETNRENLGDNKLVFKDDEEEEEDDDDSKNDEKNEEKNDEKNNEDKESSSDSSYVVKEEINESENYDNADQESGVSIKKAERNKKK